MGRAVVRLGDICTGHLCFPPRTSITASTNVFINGKGAVRGTNDSGPGDAWAVHVCDTDFHAGIQIGGSATVLVNGKPLARIADAINCGSFCAMGSTNVFAG